MLWATLIIAVSVGAGTALALLPGGRASWMGPVRTFALTAAVSVVLFHLLPVALARSGASAVAVFALGMFAPEALGRLGASLFSATRGPSAALESAEQKQRLALEASYFGLLLHRVGDGVGLGAFTGEMHAWSGSGGVLTAMAAHAIPVVAIVVLTFDSLRGRDSALLRAGGLGVASILGVVLAHGVLGEAFEAAEPWIAAFVAGTLLHVVSHDLRLQPPHSVGTRTLDMTLGGAGILITLAGSGAHHHDDHSAGAPPIADALLSLAVETAPWLLLGLAASTLVQVLFPSRFVATLVRGTSSPPLDPSLHTEPHLHPASRGSGTAQWVRRAALPQLGLVTGALGVGVLGWQLALLWVSPLLALASGAAWAARTTSRPKAPTRASEASALEAPAPEAAETALSRWSRVRPVWQDTWERVGPWVVLSILIAALIQVALPSGAVLHASSAMAGLCVVLLLTLSAWVSVAFALPLAGVLLDNGLSSHTVILGLLLAPALHVAVSVLRTRTPINGSVLGSMLLIGCVAVATAWGAAHLSHAQLGAAHLSHAHAVPHDSHLAEFAAWQWALTGLCLLALLDTLYHTGVRGFFATLRGTHRHGSSACSPGQFIDS